MNQRPREELYASHKAMAFWAKVRVACDGLGRIMSDSQRNSIMSMVGFINNHMQQLYNRGHLFDYANCPLCKGMSLDNDSNFRRYFPSARDRLEALPWFQRFIQTQDVSPKFVEKVTILLDLYLSARKSMKG
jgi:hypothetical protein